MLVIQCAVAFIYCGGAYLGWFGVTGTIRHVAVAFIGGYHLFHGFYVVRWRMRGELPWWGEWTSPIGDIGSVTAAWLASGSPTSAVWGVYLMIMIGYARRRRGSGYAAIAFSAWVTLMATNAVLTWRAGDAIPSPNLIIMGLTAAATAGMANAICETLRRAEQRALDAAATDPLTGVANRIRFVQAIEAAAEVPAGSFSVAMLDLDDFKRLNDVWGHIEGDSVLKETAAALASGLRAGDILARFGGEEFVVLLPRTSLEEAVAVAERLRRAVEAQGSITLSAGVAVRANGEPATEVLARADRWLLAAKRSGKNCVRVAPESAAA